MRVNVIFGLLHNLLPFVENTFLTGNCSASKRNKCTMYVLQLISKMLQVNLAHDIGKPQVQG